MATSAPDRVLITTVSASSDAEIFINTAVDWTLYDQYRIEGENVIHTNDNNIGFFRFTDDGGSTYAVSGDFVYEVSEAATSATQYIPLTAQTLIRTAEHALNARPGNAAGEAQNFSIDLFCPNDNTNYVNFFYRNNFIDSTGNQRHVTGGGSFTGQLTSIDGLSYRDWGASGIASGEFLVYGYSASLT